MITVRLEDTPICPCVGKLGLGWNAVSEGLPESMISVLAWDGEDHYIAIYASEKWHYVHLDEEIDSVITHWCYIPVPEEAA
jgi:hypothetical protein